MEERHDYFGCMVARAGWRLAGDGGQEVDLVGDVYGDGVGTGFEGDIGKVRSN